MAIHLYRLGRLAARRAWATIVLWVLVLGLAVTGALTLGKPFTSEMTIPGTEFQQVLDDLKTELPAAAGGIGTVAVTTADGSPFTATQKEAAGEVMATWSGIDGVTTVVDPFTTQQEMDAGAAAAADGAAKLADGKKLLAENEARIAEGRAHIAAGQERLDRGEAALESAEADLAESRAQLADAKQAYAALSASPRATAEQLAVARSTVEIASAKVATGARQIAENRAALEAAAAELARGTAELEAGEKELNEARAALPAQEAALDRGQRRIALMHGMRVVNTEGNTAVVRIVFDEPMPSVPQEVKDQIPAAATSLAETGVTVNYSQDIVQDLKIMGLGEVLGLLVAGLVLVVMLGSLLAAGLPLLAAVTGVAVGVLGAVAATVWVDMNSITPALAVMLGLAVGIDYSLFIVNRHREQLREGTEVIESIGRATGTAGSAVLVAGLTVIVALAALTLTGIPFLGIMGLVAAATVSIAVLVALTLTPALLGLMGQRVMSRRARKALGNLEADTETDRSVLDRMGRTPKWGPLTTRRPIVTLVLATILLSVLAIPALSLKLGLPDGSYEPRDSTAYATYQTIGEKFGPGMNGPVIAVAKLTPERAAGLDADAVTDLQLDIGEQFMRVDGVSYVVPIGASDDNRTLAWQVTPETGPTDDATARLVTDLRAASYDIVQRHDVSSVGYSGQTVANIDISNALAAALPTYLAVVVGISLILLLLVFRSIIVPVLATAGFLLSVAAAFGAVVAVYQWGWLGSLFGVEQAGLVLSFLPTLVIGILFGLAMDYQMFLVTGMREAWAHGEPARAAVRTGFRHGARVVTAAALIMTAVFASFIHAELTMIRPIGFALAIGVLIDAFVVRMTAMPAVMHLLGEHAWYLPTWLDRILPNLDVEGTSLLTELEAEGLDAEVEADADADEESRRTLVTTQK